MRVTSQGLFRSRSNVIAVICPIYIENSNVYVELKHIKIRNYYGPKVSVISSAGYGFREESRIIRKIFISLHRNILSVNKRRFYDEGGMKEMYRSKDIFEATGIPRNQLNEYKDIIKPVRYETEGQYKVFDDDALVAFKFTALCKKFKVPRKVIMESLKKDTFSKQVLLQQKEKLHKEINNDKKLIKEIESLLSIDLEKFLSIENADEFKAFLNKL